jgi:hypothetical protein
MGVQFFGPGYNSGSNGAYGTDSKPGGSVFVGTTTPTNPEIGDVWIDNTAGSPTLTAKGQLAGFNGTQTTAVNVGSDGMSLVADSTQSAGLNWAFKADEISTIMGVY